MAFIVCFILAGCGSNLDRLRRTCEANGRVQIHDSAAWDAYVKALRREYGNSEGRAYEEQTHLRFDPVQGFEFENEFARGKEIPQSSPTRNDVFITQKGRPVATVVNYTLLWQGFASGEMAECVIDHPEVYGVTVEAKGDPG